VDQDSEALLKELTDARDKIREQIERVKYGRPLYAMNRGVQVRGIMEQLTNTLRELEECITELEPNTAASH
jgi:hypothetical protein